jgi:hypothetical protein
MKKYAATVAILHTITLSPTFPERLSTITVTCANDNYCRKNAVLDGVASF